MHTNFIDLSATLHNEYLLKTEALFVTQKKRWFGTFLDHFQSICTEITKLQKEASIPAISRMEYTMFYTNFIKRRYVAEIWVYGDKRYLDKEQRMVGEYDISFLFVYFDELWNKLLSSRKYYVGKVTAQEIKAIVMQALPDYYSYFINIVRFAIVDFIDKKLSMDFVTDELFKVNVGDYMAKTEPVFIKRKRNKDANTLVKWFEERLENMYSFEDYSTLDFSRHSFTHSEFRYSHFCNSCLINTSFKGSVLIGASFYKARMENCCLDNCSLYEVNFSYAILRNASFVMVRGRSGLPDEEEWWHVGFLPVNFHNADLTNANFTGANLAGADFNGAILTGVNFVGANLANVDFTGATLTDADFTDAVLDNAIYGGDYLVFKDE